MQINANDEFPELNEHLTALYQRLNGDLTPLMRGIGALLEGSTRDRFRTKRDPGGVAWANLAPETVKSKNARGGILVDHGDLMRSITYHASSQAVAVGTDRPYGKYHQTGTNPYIIRPKDKKALSFNGVVVKQVNHPGLPARPFLGLSTDDKAEIRELINDFMSGVING